MIYRVFNVYTAQRILVVDITVRPDSHHENPLRACIAQTQAFGFFDAFLLASATAFAFGSGFSVPFAFLS